MALMEVTNLKKSFDQVEVLKQITFSVEKNDVIAVIGPSGSGKSTMLRSLIHLEEIDGGSIVVDGDYLVQDGRYTKPQDIKAITAKMGMVFQHFNLFPHLTVQQNLEMAPSLLKQNRQKPLQNAVKIYYKKLVLPTRPRLIQLIFLAAKTAGSNCTCPYDESSNFII